MLETERCGRTFAARENPALLDRKQVQIDLEPREADFHFTALGGSERINRLTKRAEHP